MFNKKIKIEIKSIFGDVLFTHKFRQYYLLTIFHKGASWSEFLLF